LNLNELTPADFLGDPLSEATRRERRNLLASSATAILIAHTGLIPTRISALGIELSSPAQNSFLLFLAVVVSYFIAAFATYGFSDFLIWRHKYQDYLEKTEIAARDWGPDDQLNYDDLHSHLPKANWLYGLSKRAAYLRIIFECALPVLVGLYAIYALLSEACST
jgi:hypothetical protein